MTTASSKAAFEEGAAISLLRELGDPQPPMDAFDLAGRCQLRVEYDATPRLVGDTIYVSPWVSALEQQRQVAHELGHFTLRYYDVPDSEWGADWVAAALMLPRAAFARDLAELGRDVAALALRHPNCPPVLIRLRLEALDWERGERAA